MAKPNYSHQKKQREEAACKKRQEKQLRRQQKKDETLCHLLSLTVTGSRLRMSANTM